MWKQECPYCLKDFYLTISDLPRIKKVVKRNQEKYNFMINKVNAVVVKINEKFFCPNCKMQYVYFNEKSKDQIKGLVPVFDDFKRGKNKIITIESNYKYSESPWYLKYDSAAYIFEAFNGYCPNCHEENYLEDVYHEYIFTCSHCTVALKIFYDDLILLPFEPDEWDYYNLKD